MKLQQLTFTRFVAALGIVVLHYAVPFLAKLSGELGLALHYINSFVSYFFLLSGFILVVSSAGKSAQPSDRQFWLNRFARIYPLYLFALVLTAIVVAAISGSQHSFLYVGGSFIKPMIASGLLAQAWLPEYAYYLNFPSWSLSVEALFYILFPCLFRALRMASTRSLFSLAVMGWLLNQGLHHYVKSTGVSTGFANAFPVFHFTTFLMGVCLGILFIRHFSYVNRHKQYIGAALLLATLVSGYLIGSQSILVRDFETGLFAPVFALIILYLCSRDNWTVRLFSQPVAIYLGEISYGVYILQAPVAIFVRHINKTYLHLNGLIAFLLLVGLLLAVAAVCYEGIEKPARMYVRRLLWRPTGPIDATLAGEQVAR